MFRVDGEYRGTYPNEGLQVPFVFLDRLEMLRQLAFDSGSDTGPSCFVLLCLDLRFATKTTVCLVIPRSDGLSVTLRSAVMLYSRTKKE